MLMAYCNLTLEEIAKFTGNAISTVGTWKNGRLPNSMATVEKLSHLFQVTPEYLLTGTLNPSQNTAASMAVEKVKTAVGQNSLSGQHSRFPGAVPSWGTAPMQPAAYGNAYAPYTHPHTALGSVPSMMGGMPQRFGAAEANGFATPPPPAMNPADVNKIIEALQTMVAGSNAAPNN
jgi:hypothetical protein